MDPGLFEGSGGSGGELLDFLVQRFSSIAICKLVVKIHAARNNIFGPQVL